MLNAWPDRYAWSMLVRCIISWPGETTGKGFVPTTGTGKCGWPPLLRLAVGRVGECMLGC